MTQNSSPRVRFAPSPTGNLHVGGARTALVNWLFARKSGGTFILRIEDTDAERSKPELTEGILRGMRWLGIDWDEGPLHQSARVADHRAAAQKLLAEGKAYLCFCSKEELDARRAASGRAEAWRYDQACRELNSAEVADLKGKGKSSVVRFKVDEGETAWDDLVHERVAFNHKELEDFVLLRSDRTPVYMISVVCDDIFSRVTHVLRGDDHISNTPKQILLYRALGAPVPTFGHLPLIFGADKKKLSKRHGATLVSDYAELGILAESLFAFLAQLGLSYGDEVKALSAKEMVDGFSLDNLKRSASIFDLAKLQHLNATNLSGLPASRIAEEVAPRVRALGLEPGGDARYAAALDLMRTRARDLNELAAFLRPFLTTDFPIDEKAAAKAGTPEAKALLRDFLPELEKCAWEPAPLEAALRAFTDARGKKAADLIHPIRLALLGMGVSPGLFDVLIAMGREPSLERVRRFVG